MKTKIYSIDGKQGKDVELPNGFSEKVREDVIARVVEALKVWQAHGVSPIAGRQQKAQGKLVHRRHVWRSGYGYGISRVPRKIMSRRGNRFNWVAAEVPNVVGGRRAHPPKNKLNFKKINKKELKIAFASALSATGSEKMIKKKYSSLKDEKIEAPFVVDSKIVGLKTKKLLESLEKILGKELFGVAVKKKRVRAGKGKMRGRKYKSNAGVLVVVGKKENLKTNMFDVQRADALNVMDLAEGGAGRLVVYTEEAIKDLGDRK